MSARAITHANATRPRDVAVYDAGAPAEERAQALAAALPPALREILAAGTVRRQSRFSEDDRFLGVTGVWQPPATVTPEHAQMARRALMDLEDTVLAPADPLPLLGRVLALLSHFPARGLAADVEQAVAGDWADDLAEYPLWAVEQAARQWRRSRKWRPSIAEMRNLCDDICAVERDFAKRLVAIVKTAASAKPAAPPSASIHALASRAIRRM